MEELKTSAALRKAVVKYSQKKIANGDLKRLTLQFKPDEHEFIEQFSNLVNLSRTQTIIKSVDYIINNGIDLSEYIN